MSAIVILLIILLLVGGGWGWYGGRSGYGGGVSWGPLGLILVVFLILYLLGVVHV